MSAWLDNVKFNPTAGGTTDWTVSTGVSNYQTPALAGAVNGRAYVYFALDTVAAQWEIGTGNYNTTGPVLPRTTVLYNSAGTGTATGQSGAGTKINFTNVPQVSIVGVKEDLISIEEANTFTAVQQAQALSNIGGVSGGLVNKFRNGNFDTWQRGTAATTVTTAGAYTADGWIVLPTGASVSVDRQFSSLNLSFYSLRLTGATSVTDAIIKQRIESLMAAPLVSQNVTVQAKIFNNTGGSITPTLTVKRPTAQDNWAATTTDVNAVSLQACANGQWTTVAYTFAADASSYNGLEIAFDFGNNFSTNGKAIQICEADIRATPGITVGLNSAPPVPEMRPVGIEFVLCQRYYQQTTSAVANHGYASGWCFNSTVAFGYLQFPTMRATPTTAMTAGSTFQALLTASTFNGSAISITPYNQSSALIQLTVTGATAGAPGIIRDAGSNNSSFSLSAEL